MDARGETRFKASGVVATDAVVAGTRVGDFEITTELGSGGMGTVYAARHPLIGKEVAVKIVNRGLGADPEVKARFVDEARALTQIDHPNVVDVYSFGELEDGRSYLVMELLSGQPLGDLIDDDALDFEELLELLCQTAEALRACHERGVIHRDLKPDNIFVIGRGDELQIKLFDFGIAKLEGLRMEHELTGEGTVIGTPAYMSPEQIRGGRVDHRSDLYALGVIAYEAISRSLPFRGATPVDTLALALTKTPRPLSESGYHCPLALERLIGELMAKDRDRRPSLGEVRERLERARARPAAGPAPRPYRRRLFRLAPGALIAAGLCLGAISMQGRSPLAISPATAAAAIEPAPQPEPAAAAPQPQKGADKDEPEPVAASPAAPRSSRAPKIDHPDALIEPFARGRR